MRDRALAAKLAKVQGHSVIWIRGDQVCTSPPPEQRERAASRAAAPEVHNLDFDSTSPPVGSHRKRSAPEVHDLELHSSPPLPKLGYSRVVPKASAVCPAQGPPLLPVTIVID